MRHKPDLLVANHQQKEEFMEDFVGNSTGTAAFSILAPVLGRSFLSLGERPELQSPQRKGISATESRDQVVVKVGKNPQVQPLTKSNCSH